MKFVCEHGFYTFIPETMDDQTLFQAHTGYKLVYLRERLTFAPLAKLPDFCIKGQPYGGLAAKVNYCATPAEILRANGFVFDLKTQKLAPMEGCQEYCVLWPQQNGGLIALYDLPQAGTQYEGQRLLSFSGVVRFSNQQFILRTYEFN